MGFLNVNTLSIISSAGIGEEPAKSFHGDRQQTAPSVHSNMPI